MVAAFWGAAVLFGDNDSSALAFGVRLYLPQRGEHSQVEEETPIILWAAVFMPNIEGVQLGLQNHHCSTAAQWVLNWGSTLMTQNKLELGNRIDLYSNYFFPFYYPQALGKVLCQCPALSQPCC